MLCVGARLSKIRVAAEAFLEVRPRQMHVNFGCVPGRESGTGLGDLEGELLGGSAEVVGGRGHERAQDFDGGLDDRFALERMLLAARLAFLSLRRLLTSFMSRFI
jgi:hypothetical protein